MFDNFIPPQAYNSEHFGEPFQQDESYYCVKTAGSKTYLGLQDDCDVEEFFKCIDRAEKEHIPFDHVYLSRTIEVQENQKVIDTGLYGIVRHPMYSATLLLFLSMPIVLGSVYSFLIFLAYPFIIAKRIKAEEEFLEKELSGYSEYKKKVKYRLIPFIW